MGILSEINEWENGEAVQTLIDCGLAKGMAVMDFGCGVPHYTFPAAKIVGSKGVVYAVDKNNHIIELVKTRADEENASNIQPIKTNEKKIKDFDKSVHFIMYYDCFHGIGEGMNGRIEENGKLFREFYRLLDNNGILSIAVYKEITYVMDYTKEPKEIISPSGKRKLQFQYQRVSFDDAFQNWYKIIPLVESCGFSLKSIVKNGGVHFDEIDFKLHLKKNKDIQFSDLEHRDIYNFIKI